MSDGLLLGIDPGGATEHTGLAFLQSGKGLDLHRLDFLDAVALITERAGEVAVAVIEDARALPLYARHRKAPREARDRIARSVGQVDGNTATFAALLDRLGIPHVLREPTRRPKWDAEEFARITGYDGPSSQHERDAARLVFGYDPEALLLEARREARSNAPSTAFSTDASPA